MVQGYKTRLNMKNIKIYGHSDDCIEITGDISDEGYVGNNNIGYVELSTGDVFKVHYTKEGVWRISKVDNEINNVNYNLIVCHYDEENEEESGYTDQMYIVGKIEWIKFWKNWPVSRDEYIERIVDTDRNTWSRLSLGELKTVIQILEKNT